MDTPHAPAAPPALRRRSDGWTAERQSRFIRALGETGSVTAAAARVGMTPQAAHWLRRQPGAGDFRTAWDATLALAWREVEATALERVINGETETWDRDGVRVVRHRPCAPHLLVQMVDRAIAAREKAESVAAAAARAAIAANIAQVRADIRALADPDQGQHISNDGGPPRKPPVIEDALTLALRRLDELSAGFVDHADEAESRGSGK